MDFFQRLDLMTKKLLKQMESLDKKLKATDPDTDDREYVDSSWVYKNFNISSSTLSDYRKRGIIPYTYFEDRGKYFYKRSDL